MVRGIRCLTGTAWATRKSVIYNCSLLTNLSSCAQLHSLWNHMSLFRGGIHSICERTYCLIMEDCNPMLPTRNFIIFIIIIIITDAYRSIQMHTDACTCIYMRTDMHTSGSSLSSFFFFYSGFSCFFFFAPSSESELLSSCCSV